MCSLTNKSKMRAPGTLWFFVTLVSLTQVKEAAGDCNITSISSSAASSLLVKWNSFPGATSFTLDAKVVNSTTIATVSVGLPASYTEKLVQGLRPGHIYQVTLKVLQFYYVMCINSQIAQTVPGTSQITLPKAISSTSIKFEWSSAFGADRYILGVDKALTSEHYEQTFYTLSGQINNLQPSTAYNCYVYSANAAGLGARSLVKTIRTLVQPPNGVHVVGLSQSSARVSWLSVSGVVLYQVIATANNKPGIAPLSRNTSSISLEIPDLVPCTTYTIGVSSISMFLEPGEPSNVTYTTANIPQVTEILATYNCVNAMASVSWDTVFGATSYQAIAMDGQGRSLNCTSTDTTCQISTLSCGERYTVRIKAIADCESTSDASYVFETAPCPPKHPNVYRECSSNVIIFSWNATNNTAYYTGMAVDSGGETIECLTVDTSCYFTNMGCGKTYNFTVSSIYSEALNCNSGNTNPVVVSTAPCLPQNVHTTSDCSTGTAFTSWDLAEGAQTYVVEARGNRRDFYNCSTHNNNCMLTDLDCGESLSVWIIAKNEYCTTDPVLGEVAETVPCAPQNVSAVDTCSSNSATLSWLTSNGAVFYIAVATHSNGTMYTCVAMATECEFQGLKCGETYDAYVLATNMQCNSSQSEHVTLRTAPCAPASVGVLRDCGTNQASVSWQTLQTGGLYTAMLQDAGGPSLNCSTGTNTCTVPNLRCGAIYNVSVTYHNGRCRSLPCTTNQIRSAPCNPQNVTSVLQCDTNIVTVTWNTSAGACGYTAMARAAGQLQPLASCRTNGTSCQLISLPCGMRLNVTVQAQDATCNSSSQASAAIITTAPCVPTNITASLNCTSKIASINWYGTLGATGYQVKAEGSYGHRTSCNTTDTRCDIVDLRCGQEYNITVVGKNADCMSQASQSITLISAPCPNTGVQARLDCRTNAALLSWTPGNGTLRFNATLQSSRDSHQHSCTTNSSSCNITSLHCGERYNVSVTGYGQSCSSCSTTLLTVETAPCVPTQVNVSLPCQSDTASVSWTASSGPVLYYIATAENANGRTLTCNSSSTSCNISSLMCGQAYNVSVTAISANCTGERSEVYRINTAPCASESVVSQLLDCQTGAVRVSWRSSIGALSYYARAQSTAGNILTCNSTSTSCVISAIGCGQTYNITVVAEGNGCSTNSLTSQITAGPCPPSSVSAVLLGCSTNTALVSWNSTARLGVQYTARAIGATGPSVAVECNTTNSSCSLTNLQCGSQYNISVTASGNNCTSTASTVYNFRTAPCAPVLSDTVLNCSSRSAVVMWSSSGLSPDVFSVSAVNAQGAQLLCGASNGSSCVVDGLQCGQIYTFSVNATQGQCTSTASNTLQRQTAPCPPQNIQSIINCDNTVSVSWSRGNGTLSYVTTLECSNGQTYTCRTNATGCDITNMPCGQTCTVKVVAVGPSCNSSIGTGPNVTTTPCASESVVSQLLDCQTGAVRVSWRSSIGALSYYARAQSTAGNILTCNSTSTSCVISAIGCGQTYNITVVAEGNGCSTNSLTSQITAGPCPPSSVSAVLLGCSTNTALVSWNSTARLGVQYTARAIGATGPSVAVECNTTNSSCSLTNLQCGSQYNISVTASGNNCTSTASTVYNFRTAPCAPVLSDTVLNCSSRSAVVMWSSSGLSPDVFSVSAVNAQGAQLLCGASNGSSCVVDGLQCGQIYTFSVNATQGQCTSTASNTLQRQTAPCPPQNIQSIINCDNTVSVSWSRGNGTLSYVTTLECSNGQTYTCRTNATGCDITNMPCGQTCTVKVVAVGPSCNSSIGTGPNVTTTPCASESVVSQLLDCQTGAVRVSWRSSIGALSYYARAQSTAGNILTCNSTSTSCVISAIGCGQTYNITVVAEGNGCSTNSLTSQITAGPCPPSSVSAVLLGCSTNTALVSWNSTARLGVQYTARAIGATGPSVAVECNTTNSSCSLTNLQCGSQYNISVTASGNNCTSTASTVYNFRTAPCAPVLSDTVLNCSSRSAVVMWSSSGLSPDVFSVSAVNAQGAQLLCGASNGSSCVVDGLQCGQIYTFSVNATQGQCTSTASNTLQRQTAPCPPQNIQSIINCDNTVSVSWSRGNGTLSYVTTLECSNGQTYTCRTNATGCDITNMPCGQTCTVKVVAVGPSCNSSIGTGPNVTTTPCASESVVSQLLDCQTGAVRVSWRSSIGALSYYARAQSTAGNILTCNSTSTSCVISAIGCGQTYNITVVAEGNGCSTNSLTSQITAGPCPPSSVSAVLLGCSTNTALVSWNSTARLGVQYTARAIGATGPSVAVECNTTNSSCSLTNLQCGSQYNISVTASGNNCTSTASTVYNFRTAPCAPVLSDTVLNCSSRSAVVMWSSSGLSPDVFSVSAVNAQGAQLLCGASNGSSCVVDGLQCGQIYTFSVNATQGQCTSTASNTLQRQTAPCPPQNIQSIINCDNTVSVSWSRGNGTLSYVTTLECSNGQTYTCRTNATGCDITNMPCGQTCTVKVVAVGPSCNSSIGTGPNVTTTPCASESVVSQLLDCQTGAVRVSWRSSIGALSYYARAQSTAGNILTCNSTSTSCVISAIGCGQTYNITVVAEGNGCSTNSLTSQITAGPCPPSSVSAVLLGCSTNTALVSWNSTARLGVQYTARAIGATGPSVAVECNTTNSSCSLTNLQCGSQYNISVTASGNNCTSTASTVYNFRTAPCAPVLSDTVLNCSSRSAVVMWSSSGLSPDVFSVSAVNAQGAQLLCGASNGSSCVVDGLQCGQIYTFSVNATQGQCTSTASNTLQRQTAPCPPQNIQSIINCDNTVSVSWSRGNGTLSYVTTLECSNGQTYTCRTNATGCDITNMPCGQTCTVKVVAVGPSCNSSIGTGPNVTTTPCASESVVSQLLDCQTGAVRVSWRSSIGALSYYARAQSTAGNILTCNSTSTSCVISAIGCGQTYNITVVAEGNGCSTNSLTSQITAGPCPPSSVSAVLLGCSTNTALVSWNSTARLGVQYTARAIGATGPSVAVECNTTNSSCSLTNLQCGSQYNISVTASGNNCTSTASTVYNFRTAPCAPVLSDTVLNCSSRSAVVMWSSSGLSPDVFSVSAVNAQGAQLLCGASNGSSCVVDGLQCGQIYTFSVNATQGQCTSTASNTLQRQTAPCPPQNIQSIINCDNTVSVSWSRGNGTLSYVTTLECSNGQTYTCRTNATGCDITNMPCGQTCTVKVVAVGPSCNSSIGTGPNVTTTPCASESVVSQLLDCQTGAVRVSWRSSIGALSYYARAQSTAGNILTCNSTSTSCVISAIGCGQTYNITVVAEGNGCSTNSLTSQITAGPCPPSSVSAVLLGCSTNTALVSWNSTARLGVQYTARAIGATGPSVAVECNTTNSSCSLTNLQCGSQYNISVTASGNNCTSTASTVYNFRTAPCAPVLSDTVLNCSSRSAVVMWSSSGLSPDVFSVSAVNAQGAQLLCGASNGSSCVVDGLQCGQIYTFSVNATQGQCTSTASNTLQRQTAPCPPQNIQSIINCDNTVSVSWSRGNGTLSYVTTLECSNGQTYTCRTNATGCDITNMPCGQTCTVKVVAVGPSCNSSIGTGPNVTTTPCASESVVSQLLDCQTGAVRVSWRSSIGALSYYARAQSTAGNILTCNSTSTSCVISAIGCGQTYNITVVAEGNGCSTNSLTSQITAGPCPPSSVSAVLLGCSTNTALVSWNSTARLGVQYTARAIGATGPSVAVECNTTNSSCSLTNLQCGSQYNISVTASGNNCTSTASTVYNFRTAPCAPVLSDTVLNCSSRSAVVMWSSSGLSPDVFSVSAVNAQGAQLLCGASNGSSCVVDGLQCGQIYTFSVNATQGQCTSTASNTLQRQTAPCPPQNIQSIINCDNTVSVSWSRGNGTLSYVTTLECSNGQTYTCRTNATGCDITNMPCGQTCTVKVVAVGPSCNSSIGTGPNVTTTPCASESVVSQLLDCQTGAVRVSWRSSIGALSYYARAQSTAGNILTCNSTSTSCVISAIGCGQTYNITVVAEGNGCSTNSLTSQITAGPCPPSSVSAVLLGCSTNTALVSWNSTARLGVQYTARAIGATGPSVAVECNTTNSSCSLTNLQCGSQYNISVTASGNNCTSTASTVYNFRTAPCAPVLSDTVLNCSSRSAVVMWSSSGLSPDVFSVSAVNAQGAQLLCGASNGSSCVVDGLQCGQIYTFSVNATQGQCTSTASNTLQRQTAPCPPQNIQSTTNCGNTVSVSWSRGNGTLSYVTTLECSNGQTYTCRTNATGCDITNMPCGQTCTVKVVAVGPSCNSSIGTGPNVTTAPCAPRGVNGTLDCVTNSAWVSWNVDTGVGSYTVLAVGDDGQNSSCSTSNSTCNVPDLGCGKTYTFSVTASNAACRSSPSSSFQLETAPCALSSIVVVAECQSRVIQVQWQRARSGNSLYIATAEGQDRSLLYCNSSASSCNLTGVQCGMEYTVIVAASSNRCSSLRSPPYKISTAPCQPTLLDARTDCQSQTKSVFVSWQPSYVAKWYTLTVVGRGGDVRTNSTVNSNFTLTDLRCSHTYYLSVSASHENCTSLPSPNITFSTVPCKPTNLTLGVNCGNSSATLSWAESPGAVAYVGLAQSENGTTVYCQTRNTSCTLQGLVCGTVYNFTVQASDGICNGSNSDILTGGAAPCPPAGLRVIPRTVVNETQILRASWSAGDCPRSEYLLQVQGGILGNAQALFDVASYWTSRTFFEIPLPCGSSYSATIRARNSAGESIKSIAAPGTTVPCAPLNVMYSAPSTVTWSASILATNYTVYGLTSSGRTLLCMTSQLFCSMANISSGYITVTARNTAGESQNSLPVLVTAGLRRR